MPQATRLPLCLQQLQKINSGKPHEVHSKKTSLAARKIILIKLGKNVVLFFIKVPLYSLFNLALIIAKLGETILRLVGSIHSKAQGQKLKSAFFACCDYTILFFLYPVIEITLISKLILAVIVSPTLYFKPPAKTSLESQLKYYKRNCENLFKEFLILPAGKFAHKNYFYTFQASLKQKESYFIDQNEKVIFFKELKRLLVNLQEDFSDDNLNKLETHFKDLDLLDSPKDLVRL